MSTDSEIELIDRGVKRIKKVCDQSLEKKKSSTFCLITVISINTGLGVFKRELRVEKYE